MEHSYLSQDIYPLLLNYMDWSTLNNFSLTNTFCNQICKKEKNLRLNSKYPFGEAKALIKVIANDITLDSISIIIDDKEINIKDYNICLPSIKKFISQWFVYHLPEERWILTGRIAKATLRYLNKANQPDRESVNLMGNYQCYIFKILPDGTSTLIKIF